ncbi:hypothetical protein EI94DRAFT_1706065 [Lactarius quietus]|nr:hypothetical protein EI94DRAFT_1706065 [Lactarius quietus]
MTSTRGPSLRPGLLHIPAKSRPFMSLLALEEQEFPLSTSSILQSSIVPSDSASQVDQSFEKAKAQRMKKESSSELRRTTDKCMSTTFSNAGGALRRNGERKAMGVRGCFGLILAVEPGFCAQLKKREEVEERILDYCIREGLYEQGITIADLLLTIANSNMGWHGESAVQNWVDILPSAFSGRMDGILGNLDTLDPNTPLLPSLSRYNYRYCRRSLSTPYRAPRAIAKMLGHYTYHIVSSMVQHRGVPSLTRPAARGWDSSNSSYDP